MKPKKICSVYDNKAEAWLNPFTVRSSAEAIRTFSDECNNPQSMFTKHPNDYTLFEIGEFYEGTGNIESYSSKRNLGAALEYNRASEINFQK